MTAKRARDTTPIALTQEEIAHLIRASGGGKSVQFTYPGGRLMITDGNLWALKEIARLRGVEV